MLRSTRMVVLLGLAVQIAAFLRTAIIAAALGTSPDVDAYNLGLIAPSFLSTVIGSWLQLGFIGRYTSLVTTGAVCPRRRLSRPHAGPDARQRGGARRPLLPVSRSDHGSVHAGRADRDDRVGGRGTSAFGTDPDPDPARRFLALILNSHGRFFAAAFAPLVNALVSVAGLWFWHSLDLQALVWTLLLGSLAQCRGGRIRAFAHASELSARDEPGKRGSLTTLTLAIPLLPATMLANASTAIVQFRAAELGEGAVAIYGYASRLHGALAQVLVIGLSTVLLPHFAALWSRGEKTRDRDSVPPPRPRHGSAGRLSRRRHYPDGRAPRRKSCSNAGHSMRSIPRRSPGCGHCSACRCSRSRSGPTSQNSASPCAAPAASC